MKGICPTSSKIISSLTSKVEIYSTHTCAWSRLQWTLKCCPVEFVILIALVQTFRMGLFLNAGLTTLSHLRSHKPMVYSFFLPAFFFFFLCTADAISINIVYPDNINQDQRFTEQSKDRNLNVCVFNECLFKK